MKFRDLNINQTFTITEYPKCICVKIRAFAGSCCSPPHNTKVICYNNGVAQEQVVLLDENIEVISQPSKTSVQPNLLKHPTVLRQQLKYVPATASEAAKLVKVDESSIQDRKEKKEPKSHKVVKEDPSSIRKIGGGNFGG